MKANNIDNVRSILETITDDKVMDPTKRRFKDFFDLLEVDRDVTKEDVQKAFIKKASIWHPDKAETDEDREYFTKIYQDLQTAYKILSNDNSRRQYVDAQQTTDLEFIREERDKGYQVTDQFKTDKGKFDKDAFKQAFDATRDDAEAKAWQELNQQYDREGTIKDADYRDIMSRREQEDAGLKQQQIFSGTGMKFDVGTFNRAFDLMKEQQPGTGVQLYEGTPQSMFSSGGLEETDNVSGVKFAGSTSFLGDDMDNLVQGQSVNPMVGQLDLEALNTGEDYGKDTKMSSSDIQDRIAAMQTDRDQLMTMQPGQFIVEPSEIETLYSELFAPADIEGLEAPVVLQGKPADEHPKDTTKIRQRIAVKNAEKVDRIETCAAEPVKERVKVQVKPQTV